MAPRQAPADSVPQKLWEEHKAAIQKLYLDEGCRLRDVMERMKTDGFVPTEPQYHTQFRVWGWKKNKRRRAKDVEDSSPNKRSSRESQEAGVAAVPSDTVSAAVLPQTIMPLDFSTMNLFPWLPTDNIFGQTSDLDTCLSTYQVGDPTSTSQGMFGSPQSTTYLQGSVKQFASTYQPGYSSLSVHPHNELCGGQQLRSCTPSTTPNGGGQKGRSANLESANATSSSQTQKYLPIIQAAAARNTELVEFLLEKAPESANAAWKAGFKALLNAPESDALKVVGSFIRHGADVNRVQGRDKVIPIHVAATRSLALVELLWDNGADLNERDGFGETPLLKAAYAGQDKIVKFLLENGAKTDITYETKHRSLMGPIHAAVRSGHLEVVKILLQAGVDLQAELKRPADEAPPLLYLAACNGNVTLGKFLIEQGASTSVACEPELAQPIHISSLSGHVEFVRLLIDNNAQIDSKDIYGCTPLLLLSKHGDYEIMKLLIDAGADVKAEDRQCRTPLSEAAKAGHYRIVKLLLKSGANVNIAARSKAGPLLRAAESGHFSIIRCLLDSGAEINVKGYGGTTALMAAAHFGHSDTVKYLLDAGADANAKNNSGCTAIISAAGQGYARVVNLLLEVSANFNAKTVDGASALSMAAQGGHIDTVILLLEAGADVDSKDIHGQTALAHASYFGHLAVVIKLHQVNARLSESNKKVRPIHLAAWKDHFEVVKFLVDEYEEDVNAVDDGGNTPLSFACSGSEKNRRKIVEFLYDRGAKMQ